MKMSHDTDETIAASRVPGLEVHPQSPGRGQAGARTNKFSPGDLLSNRFVIISFLGAGGMGEVYEAQDRLLQGAPVALKTISPELAALPDARERFEREVLLARQITHPNVCPIYDIYTHQDSRGVCCYLCMKLLPGQTLAERLKTSGVPAEEAISIVRQMAAALQAAHREGIVHRDIKPSNIMLDGRGAGVKAVITDFGLARRFDSDLTSAFAGPIGTPGYIAPELLKGQPASAASDLYSFGLVALEIFTGKKPADFGGRHPIEFTAALRSPTIPAFVPGLVSACLSDDPKKRYQAFRQALVQLDLDPEVSSPTYGRKPYLTRRQLIGGTIATACAAAGAVVWETDYITDLVSPLPRKRFVALVSWPNSDSNLKSVVSGVLDALEKELSRAEAFDHDLFVVAGASPIKDSTQLNEVRDSLGANLVLASSAVLRTNGIKLSIQILDTSVGKVLRQRMLTCAIDEISLLPGKAVRAAAELLGVSRFIQDSNRLTPGTQSVEAYQTFQTAEALFRQPNGEGVEAAIEQYKQAVEQDSRYAAAYTSLALAYCYQYGVRRELAALDLARANANTALSLDQNQIGAHLALSCYWRSHGEITTAIEEMRKALSLDPSNPSTLLMEAQIYAAMNRFDEAESIFQQLVKVRPNYWTAYNELGELYSRQGKYPEALRAYRSANLAQPRNALALANVGQTCMILGRLREARQSLEQSMSLHASGYAAAVLAEELRVEGNFAAAVRYARQAVELDPSDIENWLELGDCLSEVKSHLVDARKAYLHGLDGAQQRVQMNHSDGPGWMLLALFQAKTGDVVSAQMNARKAEALGATELDSQLSKARILEVAGQRGAAVQTLSACFHRGATKFQIDSMPDLHVLRADPRYQKVFRS